MERTQIPNRRRTALWLCLALGAGLGAATPVRAAETLALTGARVHTVANGTIPNGVILIHDGLIAAVGPAGRVNVPPGATVHDLSGKVIIPGLVDTHSHVGIYPRPGVQANADGNETTGPIQPQLRALDAIHPGDPGIRMAAAGGVTTANIMPGSGNLMGGQTAYVKLRGDTIEAMLITREGMGGGMKMANGENPKRSYGPRQQSPATRMAAAALQRRVFIRAREYQRQWEEYRAKVEAGEEMEPPERDLELEPVVEILERRRTVHHHTHRADDIMTVLRLQEEFGYEVVLQHATEAYKVAEEIARRRVPVSIIVIDSPGGKHEATQLRFDTGAILERAGALVAVHTDDFITSSRLFLRSAALAVRGGMTEEAALAAVTLNPARMMHLEDRIGSLEVGKDADLVVLSGPPFSVYTQVLQTYIEGAVVFDRRRPEDRRYATGGFQVADRYPDREGTR